MPRFVRNRVAEALALFFLAFSAACSRAEVTPIAGWDKQLFPSYLIASATMRLPDEEAADDSELLGDREGVLGVKVEAPDADTPIKVTITSDAILEPSTFSGTLDEAGTTYSIFPNIKYKYAALAKIKQSMPVTVTFRVEIGDEEAEERTETLTLHSVNDCQFSISQGDDNYRDVSYVFAAYVNEQHPFVDKVLREALDLGIVDSFTGYQSKDPAEVYRQVYAIWDALSKRDVRYSNITASAAESEQVSSQNVRLIDESINNAQANCVDGSVLLASVLRKIDIEPVLVFVPGHCYLGFYLDAEGKQLIGLETTMIGSVADDGGRTIKGVEDVVDPEQSKSNSWGTFCAAIVEGTKDLKKNQAKFDAGEDPDYQLIPIAAARKQGILPIAFDSNDRFQATTPSDEE